MVKKSISAEVLRIITMISQNKSTFHWYKRHLFSKSKTYIFRHFLLFNNILLLQNIPFTLFYSFTSCSISFITTPLHSSISMAASHTSSCVIALQLVYIRWVTSANRSLSGNKATLFCNPSYEIFLSFIYKLHKKKFNPLALIPNYSVSLTSPKDSKPQAIRHSCDFGGSPRLDWQSFAVYMNNKSIISSASKSWCSPAFTLYVRGEQTTFDCFHQK